MCWRNTTLEKKIATEDVNVFKIAKKNDNDAIISLYNEFHYELNKLYNTNIWISKLGEISTFVPDRVYIGTEGFHSYNIYSVEISKRLSCITIDTKNSFPLDMIPLEKNIVKLNCVIPKESEYYENGAGEIISNRIIVKNVEPIWN